MTLFAAAFPVLPGQNENLKAFVDELNGARRADFIAGRQSVGVHERTFLQSTPMGDLIILTLEGDDPQGAFAQLVNRDDDFTRWFRAKVAELHGVDLSQPLPTNLSTLVVDSES